MDGTTLSAEMFANAAYIGGAGLDAHPDPRESCRLLQLSQAWYARAVAVCVSDCHTESYATGPICTTIVVRSSSSALLRGSRLCLSDARTCSINIEGCRGRRIASSRCRPRVDSPRGPLFGLTRTPRCTSRFSRRGTGGRCWNARGARRPSDHGPSAIRLNLLHDQQLRVRRRDRRYTDPGCRD